jgi:cytohesin
VLAGHGDIVQKLVEKGANVNAKMSDWSSPLFHALDNSRGDIAKFLIEHGASIDVADRSGYTPFVVAVLGGDFGIAELLLQRGANVNARVEPWHMTALMHVAGQKSLKAVEFLIAAGANLNLRDDRRQNALHHAVSGAAGEGIIEIGISDGDTEISSNSGNPTEVVRVLLTAGADPMAKDDEGLSPLGLARKARLAEIVRLISSRTKLAR